MTEQSLIHHTDVFTQSEIPLSSEFKGEREETRLVYSDAIVQHSLGMASSEVADTMNTRLAKIVGVEVVEPIRNFAGDDALRCAEFVFGVYRREPWALGGFTVSHTPELWNNPARFLASAGYRPIWPALALRGDVVAYGGVSKQGNQPRIWMGHYGILDSQDHEHQQLVVSKFGKGPTIRHNIHIIPDGGAYPWGNSFWFLRKHDS